MANNVKRVIETKREDNTDQALDDLCAKITTMWRGQVQGFIEIGKMLIEAKSKLKHGDFLGWIDEMRASGKLPFGHRAAQMLMKVAGNAVLSNAKTFAHLPPNYLALSLLAKAPETELAAWIRNGAVTAETQLQDIRRLVGLLDRDSAVKALQTLCTTLMLVPAQELAQYAASANGFDLTEAVHHLRQLPTYLNEVRNELEAIHEARLLQLDDLQKKSPRRCHGTGFNHARGNY